MTITRVPINTSATALTLKTGDNGYYQRLLGLVLWVGSAVSITFRSGSQPITGAMSLQSGDGQVWPINDIGWVQTLLNESLILVTDTAVSLQGVAVIGTREKP